MALTVFAEKMGFWHRGSAGIGVAPLDVCLSPPPGPVPIPYTNVLFAKDLIKGSKTVRIDGEPTALEDYSETSTSIGDEGGTLGGSVVTGVILGKGYFMVWSMTVFIEGKGVCRHGDMMGQNSASAPPSSIDAAAISQPANPLAPEPGPVAAQRAAEAKVLEATGPGDSEAKELIPCDFEKVVIKCSHCGGDRSIAQFEYSYDGGQIQDNLPRPKSGSFSSTIQLTAGDSDSTADELSIELQGGPGYACGKSHPLISITDRATNETQTLPGATSHKLKAKSKTVEMPKLAWMSPAAILAYFFFSPKTTNRYIVEVESCGVLADLSPGFRKLSRLVEVYSSDTYKFQVTIPTVFNRKYAGARTKALTGNAQWEGGLVTGNQWDKKSAYNQGHPISQPAKDAGASIVFERNGEGVKGTATFGEIIKGIVNLQNAIQETMNFIQEFQPQVGWKFDFELEVFKGDLSFEWGCKEWSDHRVYKWWKFSAELTILALKLELSFGVDFKIWRFCITALVSGAIGGEVKLAGSKENSPDDSKPWELAANGKVEGDLQVRSALGADWVKAKGKLSAGLPTEAVCKISTEEPMTVDWKIEFSGLKGEVEGSVKFLGSYTKEWTIIKKRTIGQGSFPGGDKQVEGVKTPDGAIE